LEGFVCNETAGAMLANLGTPAFPEEDVSGSLKVVRGSINECPGFPIGNDGIFYFYLRIGVNGTDSRKSLILAASITLAG
jgi:hypothetical protein